MAKIVGKDEFSNEMERMEVTTPAHADQWNRRNQQLLNNDAYLKNQLVKKQDLHNHKIDLSSEIYNQNIWYPVTGTPIPKGGLHKIHAYTTFDMGVHPAWATHSAGYTCNMEIYDKGQTWGQTDGAAICTDYSWKHTDQRPCGYVQMTHSSTPVVLLRGGGIYRVETDYTAEWIVRTDVYTYEGDTVRPGSASKFEFERATIFANLNGDATASYVNFAENSSYEIASNENMGTLFGKLKKLVNTVKSKAPDFLTMGRVPYADKLYTKRYIDGAGFDGSSNASHYGVCSTSESATEKTVDIPGFKLMAGARVVVLFTYGNTRAGILLNVSNTMAAYILYKGKPMPSNYIKSNTVLELVYDGMDWNVVGDLTQMQVESLKSQVEDNTRFINNIVTMNNIKFEANGAAYIAKVPYPEGFSYSNTRVLSYTIFTSRNATSGSVHYVVSSKDMAVEAWENELRLIWEGAGTSILYADLTIWHR